ncbi:MAG: hypothetical protein CR988_03380 [Treponema sp.]|nr:MAG: hypothetical protein CR988_03380 [Treponema sp.]
MQKIAFFLLLNYIESSSSQPRLLKNINKAIVFPLPPRQAALHLDRLDNRLSKHGNHPSAFFQLPVRG